MEADFQGWASKAGLKCADGRVIMPDAFKDQHQTTVPLVYQHNHNDAEQVLGHAVLTNVPGEGLWCEGYFNDSPRGQAMKHAVGHKDIKWLSIWANNLVQRASQVFHGVVREVSLVLAGANPGASIEQVSIRHADGVLEDSDDEVLIYTGLDIEPLVHSADSVSHAEGGERTAKDVLDTLTDEQRDVVNYLIAETMAAANSGSLEQDAVGDADDEDTITGEDATDQEGSPTMKHSNVFDKTADDTITGDATALKAEDVQEIMHAAASVGSLRKAFEAYADTHLEHGIESIETLFPDAKALTNTPEWDKRQTEWVANVLNGTSKRPFSRIKSWTADITFEEARAKGYVKGNMKKEEYFTIAKRETTPQTIYKKQKLDRDDILDITDFDVVTWMKGEMRLMLDEEIARAILVGDGRDIADADKIFEDKIRPIATDDGFYTLQVAVNIDDANSDYEEVLDQMVLNRQYLKGSGSPTFYTTAGFVANCLLLRDDMGRKLYRSVEELRNEMRVRNIVEVEVLEAYPTILGIMVNLTDYVVGTDRGGQVTMFSDFDIDFNQEKYLLETRMSGALVKPQSAMVFSRTASTDTLAIPEAPAYDPETWTVTIPTVTGVTYEDGNGDTIAAGAYVLTAGENLVVTAVPAATYYFNAAKTRWTYLRPSGT